MKKSYVIALVAFLALTSVGQARIYDPGIGRFLQEDPIGFEGGDANLYSYSNENPVNFIDPYGLFMIAIRYSDEQFGSAVIVWNSLLPRYYRAGTVGDNGVKLFFS